MTANGINLVLCEYNSSRLSLKARHDLLCKHCLYIGQIFAFLLMLTLEYHIMKTLAQDLMVGLLYKNMDTLH